ncbi:hypothetical protein KXW65_002235 [Aspergillus fumigatus]|nr:hypothetical protein KXX63_001771 [Aspergillus fumigatus]KAH1452022.1 hypothetical protein KXX58_003574 [Aspergillus fumigatus]KAH1511341.1 hypothetical protein KXX29_003733 [Aspergillus fumigatus]KAH1806388.1 hypothetical protein KXX19_002798 [Aspergillus fumigatus]KAH2004300.1 hypothetical protein KXV45_002020 [Aspergillus fumigatus]
MSSVTFHGRDRGYGSGYGRNSTPRSRKQSAQQAPPPPQGEVLATIYPIDLQAEKQGITAQITDSQCLTSYNWLGGGEPHILIPGEPPKWTPPSNPTRLAEDSGLYFRDQNAARYPSYPMEPMVQAILARKPDFLLRDTDIVACGSTLGNLLRFVRGEDKTFRILVEVIGRTVFFMRRENAHDEVIPNVYGYGHAFPEAYTTWSADVKGSESHQRVMKYDFAGMSCLVRFEADGYLPSVAQNSSGRSSEGDPAEAAEDLLSSLENVAISNLPEGGLKNPETLKISARGECISQSAIFDLKTRSFRKKDEDTLGQELPRLWIAQVPYFILAHHKAGLFIDIQVVDVRERVKRWEEDQEATLARFAELLKKIVSFARSLECGRFEITREDGATVLELRAQCAGAGRVLPPHMAEKWDDEVAGSDGSSSVDGF